MDILEAIEVIKNNNKLCCDNCEDECESYNYKDGKCYCAEALVVSALEEYIAIGTVEECRKAKERMIRKKPKNYQQYTRHAEGVCPNCGCVVMDFHDIGNCSSCGQSLEWEDTEQKN